MTSFSYSDELYHYGVIGMRWGVRRDREKYYTNRSNISKAKADARYAKAKKGNLASRYINKSIGNLHYDRSQAFKYMAGTSARLSKGKGLKHRIITKFGSKASSDADYTNAKSHEKRAQNSYLKLNRKLHARNAFNLRSSGKRYESVANSKGFSNKVVTYVNRSLDRPVSTISGRKMSNARDFVERSLATYIAGPIGELARQFIPPMKKR